MFRDDTVTTAPAQSIDALEIAIEAQKAILGEVCYGKLRAIVDRAKAGQLPTADEQALIQQVMAGNLTECQKSTMFGPFSGTTLLWIAIAAAALYFISD